MKRRLIITTIDTILNLFKDYCQGEIPADAKPVKLMYRPAEKGKLGILIDSPSLKSGGIIPVKFHLTKYYRIGG